MKYITSGNRSHSQPGISPLVNSTKCQCHAQNHDCIWGHLVERNTSCDDAAGSGKSRSVNKAGGDNPLAIWDKLLNIP